MVDDILPQEAPQTEQAPQEEVGAVQQFTNTQADVLQEGVNQEGLAAQFDQHLSNLPEVQKAFVVEMMTPEVAMLMGVLLGEEALQFFNQIADPSRILVPMDRAEAEQGNAGQDETTPPEGAVTEEQSQGNEVPEDLLNF